MRKSTHPLADFLRLILLIIIFPFLLLIIGPLLVLAAVIGRLVVFGRIFLAPGKHYRWGRLWAFLLGAIIWSFSWLGASWLWYTYQPLPLDIEGQVAEAVIPTETISLSTQTIEVVSFSTLTPTSVTVQLTEATVAGESVLQEPTATALADLPPTPAVDPSPTTQATATPIPTAVIAPQDTPTLPPTLSPTNTPLPSSPTATPLPLPTSTATAVIPRVTAAPDQREAMKVAIAEANTILVEQLQTPEGDVAGALSQVWQGSALAQVQSFVGTVSGKYQYPLQVSYQTVGEPDILLNEDDNTLFVQSREEWTFEDTLGTTRVLGDYYYTLQNQEGRWIIILYEFERLSTVY